MLPVDRAGKADTGVLLIHPRKLMLLLLLLQPLHII